MSARRDEMNERLLELLALRAVEGLAADEARELAGLAAELGVDPERDDFELAAAAIELASLEELEEPPMRLQLLLQRDARRFFEDGQGGAAEPAPRTAVHRAPAAPRATARRRRSAPDGERSAPGPRRLGPAAFVAAAAVLLAAFLLWQDLAPSPAVPTAGERRAELLREAPDAVRFDWKGTEDPAGVGADGDVVWSNARQEGFMRIAGLAPNDPGEQQYQLWIFDARRPEATPVDGGVFDVPAGEREVVVPIDAKLQVFEPGLFAVTVEQPGGVVVSGRDRIVIAGSLQ